MFWWAMSRLIWRVPFSDKREFAYSCSTTLNRRQLALTAPLIKPQPGLRRIHIA